jgi:hypothetical protein
MRGIFALLLIVMTLESFGQLPSNRYDRLTKKEFQELLNNRDKFIPADLGDTVVIVKYCGQRLINMQDQARNISFIRNGTDTAGLKSQSWLTGKDLQRSKISIEKFATTYPEKLKKELKKKGIESLIIDESKLTENPNHSSKYWLKTTYISDQRSPDDYGFVLTATNMFHDPRTGKDFEVFLPLSYSLVDLIE